MINQILWYAFLNKLLLGLWATFENIIKMNFENEFIYP